MAFQLSVSNVMTDYFVPSFLLYRCTVIRDARFEVDNKIFFGFSSPTRAARRLVAFACDCCQIDFEIADK